MATRFVTIAAGQGTSGKSARSVSRRKQRRAAVVGSNNSKQGEEVVGVAAAEIPAAAAVEHNNVLPHLLNGRASSPLAPAAK